MWPANFSSGPYVSTPHSQASFLRFVSASLALCQLVASPETCNSKACRTMYVTGATSFSSLFTCMKQHK